MDNNEKRVKVIDYLSKRDGETVVNVLMQFVSELNWLQLYTQLEHDGVFNDEDDDDTPKEMKAGLDYVREQLDEDELLIYKATVSKNLDHRMPVSEGLDDGKIIGLLEEYGEDNDLPEGWWEEFGDIDDWMLEL